MPPSQPVSAQMNELNEMRAWLPAGMSRGGDVRWVQVSGWYSVLCPMPAIFVPEAGWSGP